MGLGPQRISFTFNLNGIAKSNPYIFIDAPWDIVTIELLEKDS